MSTRWQDLQTAAAEELKAGWHWRYLPRKLTLHALNDPDAKMARCGVSERGRQWRGDANQYERDRAAMLAFCANCQRSVGASLADLRGEPAPKTKGTAVTEPERVETVNLGNETDTGETQSDDEQAGAEAAEDSTAE